jgi:5-methylcytosine-specific restriction endonuclease McrA
VIAAVAAGWPGSPDATNEIAMPQRIPTHKPLRLKSARPRRDASARPNAAAQGYCDKRHRAWRQAVLIRDAWQCQACGRICVNKREAQADHIVPIVQGGDRYAIENGQCLCHSCHSRKTRRENSGAASAVAKPAPPSPPPSWPEYR